MKQSFFHLLYNYTATGALIAGCGSYPSIVKSSISKSKTDFTSGFNVSFGNGRGSRANCFSTCSK